jgi:hypothetical protein
MVEPAVLEDAHLIVLLIAWTNFASPPFVTSVIANSQVEHLRGRPGPGLGGVAVLPAPPPRGWDSMKAVISPSLYLTVVPLIRRNGQPVFNRRSRWSTFTLHPRMAA